jgi:RNA polymerase sigma factor (sigma-70 family)
MALSSAENRELNGTVKRMLAARSEFSLTSTRNLNDSPNARLRLSTDEMFSSHANWLRQLLSRRIRAQPADIDDLVQETYLRAARQAPGTIGHPRAFLAQTALNLFRDAYRHDKVRSAHREAVIQAPLTVLDLAALAEQETRIELARIITGMPKRYRDVFVLSRFHHMTNADIATRLGIAIKTVEWRMGKALAFCMSRLRD